MAQTQFATSAKVRASITRMTEHDLLEVVEIEETCGLSIWGWNSYHRELSSAHETIMLVARTDDDRANLAEGKTIAGFVIARVFSNELHINNVAVRPQCQHMGIGTRLLSAALSAGLNRGSVVAFLEVRLSNRTAQKLYRRCGFRVTGRRKDYYREPLEDALIMSVALKS